METSDLSLDMEQPCSQQAEKRRLQTRQRGFVACLLAFVALALLGMNRLGAQATVLVWLNPTATRSVPSIALVPSRHSLGHSLANEASVQQHTAQFRHDVAVVAAANEPLDISFDTEEGIQNAFGQRLQQFIKGVAVAAPLMVTLFGVKQALGHEDTSSGEGASTSSDSNQAKRWLAGLGIFAGICMFPAVAYAASAAVPHTASSAPLSLQSAVGAGFAQAFSLIFFSEIGDKTFFIAGLLAVKYGKIVSYLGSMAALIAMSLVAVLLGQVFHAVPTSLTNGFAFDDVAAAVLFAYFGIQAIIEAASMPAGGTSGKMDEEFEEAEDVVEDFGKKVADSKFWTLFLSTCSLVFAAEFGDKSFLATIGLSAAQNPVSVMFGAVAGHGIATAIAVIGGAIISKYLSERVICFISGGFFLTFAITTVLSLFGVALPLPL